MELKNLQNTGTCALKSRGITLTKVILVSFLYIYNKCDFLKVPLLFKLPSYFELVETLASDIWNTGSAATLFHDHCCKATNCIQ
jgi:hypothetical protein